MAERATTTEDVKECFALSGDGLDFKRAYWARRELFDRWLADRDRAIEERLRSQIAALGEPRVDAIAALIVENRKPTLEALSDPYADGWNEALRTVSTAINSQDDGGDSGE